MLTAINTGPTSWEVSRSTTHAADAFLTNSGIYNASKAALQQYSNTLRVELAPFGVKVVTVVTGGIKSNIAREARSLPEDSYYIPISEEYQRRLTHSQEGAMPSEEYAKSVVAKVLKSNPPKWVWEGNKAWLVWFATSFFPKGLLVSFGFGILCVWLTWLRIRSFGACSTSGSSSAPLGRRKTRRSGSLRVVFALCKL